MKLTRVFKMLKRKLNKREKNTIAIFFIISLFVLTYNIIYTAFVKFTAVNSEIIQNEQKLSTLKTLLGRTKELNSEYAEIASKYKGPADYDTLLQDISNIAKRLDVNILNIKPTVVSDDSKLKTYAIKIQLQNDVSAFANFFHTLTEEIKSIGVERVQIEAQGKEELPLISLFIKTALFKE